VIERTLVARPDLRPLLATGGVLVAPPDARLRTREENWVGRLRNLCLLDAPLIMVLDDVCRLQAARLRAEPLELERVEHWPSSERKLPGAWRRAALTLAMTRKVLARRGMTEGRAGRLVDRAEAIFRTGAPVDEADLSECDELLAAAMRLGRASADAQAFALAVRTLDDLAETDTNDNQDDTTDQAYFAWVEGVPAERQRAEGVAFFRWFLDQVTAGSPAATPARR
jgi:hypothetical protein